MVKVCVAVSRDELRTTQYAQEYGHNALVVDVGVVYE